MPLFDKIKQTVEIAYGSLSAPNFSFVEEAEKKRPYAGLIKKLEIEFEVTETTDTNSDIAFCYYCKSREGKQNLSIRLSMVGRYGIVSEDNFLPLKRSDKIEVKKILDLVVNERVELISTQLLEECIALKWGSEEETTLFNALFSLVEEIPWRSSSK